MAIIEMAVVMMPSTLLIKSKLDTAATKYHNMSLEANPPDQ